MKLLFLLLLSSFVVSHRQAEKEVEQSPECLACIAAAAVAGQIVKIRPTEWAVLQFAKVICAMFARQSWSICDGITDQFRGEFFYVFRQLADEPTRVCGAVLPHCGDPLDPVGEGWQIPLPPLPAERRQNKGKKKRKEGAPLLKVLQLTDIHVDMLYSSGSEAECSSPVCCRPDSRPAKHSSKFKAKSTLAAGYWGTVGKCDIPLRTVRNMLQHINQTQRVDYILIAGDLINHADWKYSMDTHLEVLNKLAALVRELFPFTPTFWAIGNHEGVPVNSFAPHTVSEEFWPTILYNRFAEMNEPWISNSSDIRFRGSFSTLVMPGLRLISVNTGFCVNTNFFLYINQSDPDGTMSWLVRELHQAEMAGEVVQILAHIPPGYDDCLEGWARNYYRVVQRFSSIIVGQFFGHVHFDYFTVFYSDMTNISSPAVSVLYAAPSVTTFDYLSPAYRIYTIDPENGFVILDHDNYVADLSNATEESGPVWKHFYSARKEFNLTDLSPVSWASLAERILRSPQLQQRFFELSFRSTSRQCDQSCQMDLLCQLRSGNHNPSLFCPSSLPLHIG